MNTKFKKRIYKLDQKMVSVAPFARYLNVEFLKQLPTRQISMTNNNNQYSFISWTIFIDCISSSNGVPCHKYVPTNVSFDFCRISVLFLWSHQLYWQNNGCPYYYASYCNYFNCKSRGKKRNLILGRLIFIKLKQSINFNFLFNIFSF